MNKVAVVMPYQVEAAAVLAMWHQVEEELRSVARESQEAAQLLDDWARLRVEYERLSELASKHHRPLPEPWPDG